MDDIEVRVHSEINDYQEKFYWFTFRQWVTIILFGLTAVPFYLYYRGIIGEEPISWIIIIYAIPFAIIGFIPIQKLPAEKMIKFVFRNQTIFYQDIVYKTDKEIQLEKQYMESLKFSRKLKKFFSKKAKRQFQEDMKLYIQNNIDNDISIVEITKKSKKKKMSRKEKKQIKEQKKIAKFKEKAVKKGWIESEEQPANTEPTEQISDQEIEKMMIEYLKRKGATDYEKNEVQAEK